MIEKELNFNIEKFLNYKKECADLNVRKIKLKNKDIMYIFYESTSNDDKISNFFMKSISYDIKNNTTNIFTDLFNMLKNTIPNSNLKIIKTYEEVFLYLASGFTCIFIDKFSKVIAIETKNKLDRSITEPTTDTIIRGPKDCFTENHLTNIGLIRKRIKDYNLMNNEIRIGRRTQAKVSLLFLKDVVDLNKIMKIKDILNKIDIDGIIDSSYLREFLIKKNKSSFPQILSTERPDLCSSALLDGKIIILVENSPFALVIPGLFLDYFKSPEDNYEKPFNASFTRLVRIIAFLVTILTPALYISIMAYTAEIIPTKLLISLAIQRQGVPFPSVISVLLLLATFEILRESDIRMPSLMGSSIGIVGALVLGDAAVAAGIVSPIVVIIIAITSVSGLLFTDIDFVNAIRLWRAIFLIGASILGIIGVTIVGIIFITKLCSIETFDTPYMSPFSPFNIKDQKDNFIRTSRQSFYKRPSYLTVKNNTRLGEKNEN